MRLHTMVSCNGPEIARCEVCGRSGFDLDADEGNCPGFAPEVSSSPHLTATFSFPAGEGFTPIGPIPENNPAAILRSGADQFAAKDALYGSSYKSVGKLMAVLFPKGLTIETEAEWNRLCIMVQVVGKFHRYSANLTTGGHEDSAHDMMVYSAMLKEVTQEEAGVLSGSLK